MALTGKEEGHVKVSSVRMTSLTTVYLRQLLCLGQAGRPTCFWSGYPLCCFKGTSNWGAPDLCLPFYITIKAGEMCGWEGICRTISYSETLPPAVALLMSQVAEDQPQQTSHHYPHPQWVLMPTVLRGQWKRVLCCKSPRFAPGSIHYGHAESLSSFLKEQHVKVPESGNTLSLSCLCVWVQCF